MEKCPLTNLSRTWSYKKGCRCVVCKGYHNEVARRPINRNKAIIRSKLWRINNLERSRKNSKSYQKRHPEQLLKWQLKKYNLSLSEYNHMVFKQNNKCAICGNEAKGMQHKKDRLCVDHDKDTKKVRGLLCGHCNIGIGNLFHNTALLQKAIKYLNENGDVAL